MRLSSLLRCGALLRTRGRGWLRGSLMGGFRGLNGLDRVVCEAVRGEVDGVSKAGEGVGDVVDDLGGGNGWGIAVLSPGLGGGLPTDPGAEDGGSPGGESLGCESGYGAGEGVALTAVGHVGAAGAVVAEVAAVGDDAAGAFEKEDGVVLLKVGADGGEAVSGWGGMEAPHFAGMWGEDPVGLRLPVVGGGKVEGIGVEDDGAGEVLG